jgi:hypothetical protein
LKDTLVELHKLTANLANSGLEFILSRSTHQCHRSMAVSHSSKFETI